MNPVKELRIQKKWQHLFLKAELLHISLMVLQNAFSSLSYLGYLKSLVFTMKEKTHFIITYFI